MNKNVMFGFAAVAALFQPAALIAGPLQRADIPAEPAWVIHLDCDAIRVSSIGQFISRELEKPEAERKLEAFRAMFNFDPRTDVHGVSVYGLDSKPDDGLLVVYADFDAQRLDSLVKGAKEYQSSTHRSHTIHSWIDESRKSHDGPVKRRMYGAVAGKRVLFAQQQERLVAALDVVDGFSANMSSTKALPSLGTAGNGRFLQAACRKLQVPDGNPNAALARLTQEMRLDVAEVGGMLTATMNLIAKDEEVAVHMNSIAQGLLSLMKMQTDKPERLKLAQNLALKQEGAALNGTLSMPMSDFIDLLKAGVAKKISVQ